MKILLRPLIASSRRMISSSPFCKPEFSSRVSSCGFGVNENNPSIEPRSAPDFSSSLVNRPPIKTPSASTMIDLPDPVSPVSRFNAPSNSTRRSSISAMLEILRSCSIAGHRLADLHRYAIAICAGPTKSAALLERVAQRELHYASRFGFIQRSLRGGEATEVGIRIATEEWIRSQTQVGNREPVKALRVGDIENFPTE